MINLNKIGYNYYRIASPKYNTTYLLIHPFIIIIIEENFIFPQRWLVGILRVRMNTKLYDTIGILQFKYFP